MADDTARDDTREDLEGHALREYKFDVNGGDGVNAADAEGHLLRVRPDADDPPADDAGEQPQGA